MYELEAKLAVITGGTRGIGLEIARQLLAKGANVVLNGRSLTDEATALASSHGAGRVKIDLGDVVDPDYCTGLVARAAEGFGRIDMLVHSAGGPVPGTIMDLKPEVWMDAFAVHVHPMFHLFRAAQPFLARQSGVVLLVSSVAGLRGCPGSVAYQTVKGALIPLARALAFDHAAQGIRVNVVAPGIIRTRFHERMTDAAKAHNIANRIPLRREGTVEDVATAALAMIQNDFITGEVLTVDGGMSMRITG
jgi:3-oxoacyl-[acyl-carrier protein] reductase